ncbi:hypothetical protein [Corynebacterium diphtheriae]|uniref:hypothetical protein n=1 Tax=Corynebacterium diphtheriae TaxID=1717 RepID=UPI000245AA38|nr:hypothetical protein [Corynebacterium diphtheriae]AEX42486.1 hypothetical protein CD31A_1819 [Corynebacterium diphtheriae 31A]MBG9256669.1 hypothetical protein [Corynebacterium diphtheriae bv. mitis]MBG9291129.1 hypothetical protein [Corynebacterium diphtheriae bv. gravis]MBG9355895.1 hypothetical protein [Corynebacterium diphtheriae bv. mitis]CAB0521046.1 hypothetical protein CIP100275_01824 [Corynebacterium diphtheriae]
MPRPDPKRPREGQIGLFESEAVQEPGKVLRGRHSDAMDRSIAAAKAADLVDEIDDGILTVLRSGAWALDALESQNKPYGPAKLIDPLINALREARLTPDSRAVATDDAINQLMTELTSDDEPTDPTTSVPHTTYTRREKQRLRGS